MSTHTLFSRVHTILGWAMVCAVPLLGVWACTLTWQEPERAAIPALIVPTLTPIPLLSEGWEIIGPGIERRELAFADGSLSGQALALRFDPGQVHFQVHYSPGVSRSLDEWRSELSQAAVIVNAGLFDENDHALGLVVVDSQSYGLSFSGFGGMFQVGWDGVRVRSLVGEPFQGEVVLQAIQSFPMLVEAGGIQAPQGDGFDQRSRRTVIAQDRDGRVLLIVVAYGIVSFAELQSWLITSDLGIQIALALDGGRSTGLDIMIGDHREVYPAWSRLPAVIAAYVP